MHEYGLAADIVRRVEAEAGRAGGRRVAVLEIEVGGADRLSPELLTFWLREALRGPLTAAAHICVSRAPFHLTCECCGHRRAIVLKDEDEPAELDPSFGRCPDCRSENVRLDGEAGCRIRTLRLEEAP